MTPVAAGFLVFGIEEGVLLSGTAAETLEAMVPSFSAGTGLWSAGLLPISISKEFAGWTRLAGVIGGILFATTSARILWGERILPTTAPLPSIAYLFLILAFVGWIWTMLVGCGPY